MPESMQVKNTQKQLGLLTLWQHFWPSGSWAMEHSFCLRERGAHDKTVFLKRVLPLLAAAKKQKSNVMITKIMCRAPIHTRWQQHIYAYLLLSGLLHSHSHKKSSFRVAQKQLCYAVLLTPPKKTLCWPLTRIKIFGKHRVFRACSWADMVQIVSHVRCLFWNEGNFGMN